MIATAVSEEPDSCGHVIKRILSKICIGITSTLVLSTAEKEKSLKRVWIVHRCCRLILRTVGILHADHCNPHQSNVVTSNVNHLNTRKVPNHDHIPSALLPFLANSPSSAFSVVTSLPLLSGTRDGEFALGLSTPPSPSLSSSSSSGCRFG